MGLHLSLRLNLPVRLRFNEQFLLRHGHVELFLFVILSVAILIVLVVDGLILVNIFCTRVIFAVKLDVRTAYKTLIDLLSIDLANICLLDRGVWLQFPLKWKWFLFILVYLSTLIGQLVVHCLLLFLLCFSLLINSNLIILGNLTNLIWLIMVGCFDLSLIQLSYLQLNFPSIDSLVI